jgi:phosphoribosylaminoimidazole (AIR) synthetase
MTAVDDYINMIKANDEGSALLAKLVAPTLKNCPFVDVIREGMNGLAVLRVPERRLVMVHSDAGDRLRLDPADHARSLVDRLVSAAIEVGASPVAFANVIDANDADREVLTSIGDALAEEADSHGLAIMNGELAILGSRVNCPANVSGTMISFVEKSPALLRRRSITVHDAERRGRARQVRMAVFDPEGLPVYINSDGVGTKMEFHERAGKPVPAAHDFAAMNLDDAVKIGARVKVLSGVLERKSARAYARVHLGMEMSLERSLGISVRLTPEYVGARIVGYKPGAPALNLSGSAVSVIDEKYLANPLVPRAGEYLVVIAGKPNPRSNGITDKRKAMVEWMGLDWHKSRLGASFLDYLATPSTVLYPVFRELADAGLATSFYHMSGGAFNGKLARPLAKHGLFVDMAMGSLFRPDDRERALQLISNTPNEVAYAKWPMGNDGFITTKDPEAAIRKIAEHGLEAKVVGVLEKNPLLTGVQIHGLPGGQPAICYPGK